jgi:hypothetical protein
MKLFALLTKHWPADGVWVVLGLIALVLMVALPAAAWTHLEAATFGQAYSQR